MSSSDVVEIGFLATKYAVQEEDPTEEHVNLHDTSVKLYQIPTVKVVDAVQCTYSTFFEELLLLNQPCLFSKKNSLISQWRSASEWVAADGTPDIKHLENYFGDAIVPVADCNQKYYNSQEKTDIELRKYLQYIQDGAQRNDQCLYLKDWHFSRDYPEYKAYRTPCYFASDWLNEFWKLQTDKEDDYQFVYFGVKGSWTPFHVDVFKSYSWSANICGKKRWLLVPPGEEDKLRDTSGQLIYDVESFDPKDKRKFPKATGDVKMVEVTQEAGDVLFVPSGWHHQVWNLEDTISINHNWLNGCNIKTVWEYMLASLADVEHEIADCIEMEGWADQCQLILKCTHGMDVAEFVGFLECIGRRRVDYLRGSGAAVQFDGWILGRQHAVFDLIQIDKVLGYILEWAKEKDLTKSQEIIDICKNLKGEISDVVESENTK